MWRAFQGSALARIARIVAARATSFTEPVTDFTLLGAAIGALAPRPVAPALDTAPLAFASARLTPAQVKSRSLAATVALQDEFDRVIACNDYHADVCVDLAAWRATITPPCWGDMPPDLLTQASVPTDPLIAHLPYPAYSCAVTSAPLPLLPNLPPPLAVPGWATEWRHAFTDGAARDIVTWLCALQRCMRKFARGAPAAKVVRELPRPLAIGIDNFSPWAAAAAGAGHVIIRRADGFALLDLSTPPAAYLDGSGFNRSYIAAMLEQTGSADLALRDMLLTHGAVYLADLDPVLLLQGPLHSFFDSPAGFSSAHTEIARMAALDWFEVHRCDRLDQGEFDLPCLPLRCNPSGCVPRKLEPGRYRGIQDLGAPRTPLRLKPPPPPR